MFEKYYRRIEFRKKIAVQWNILFEEGNTKLVKLSKIITQQPKPIENRIIVDIKSVILKHLKNSHKMPEAIRQAEKIDQEPGAGENSNSPYIVTQKSENILDKQNTNITKRFYAHKGYSIISSV